MKNQWFIETYKEACREIGIESDLELTPETTRDLDKWITRKLERGRCLGKTFRTEETLRSLTEKLRRVVLNWQSLDLIEYGEKLHAPPEPDLKFLVDHRDAIFDSIDHQDRLKMNKVFELLDGFTGRNSDGEIYPDRRVRYESS